MNKATPDTAAGKSLCALLFRDFETWRYWFDISRNDLAVRPSVLLNLVFSGLVSRAFTDADLIPQVKDFLIRRWPAALPDSEKFTYLDMESLLISEFEGPYYLRGLDAPFMRIRIRFSIQLREDLQLDRSEVVRIVKRHEQALLAKASA